MFVQNGRIGRYVAAGHASFNHAAGLLMEDLPMGQFAEGCMRLEASCEHATIAEQSTTDLLCQVVQHTNY